MTWIYNNITLHKKVRHGLYKERNFMQTSCVFNIFGHIWSPKVVFDRFCCDFQPLVPSLPAHALVKLGPNSAWWSRLSEIELFAKQNAGSGSPKDELLFLLLNIFQRAVSWVASFFGWALIQLLLRAYAGAMSRLCPTRIEPGISLNRLAQKRAWGFLQNLPAGFHSNAVSQLMDWKIT